MAKKVEGSGRTSENSDTVLRKYRTQKAFAIDDTHPDDRTRTKDQPIESRQTSTDSPDINRNSPVADISNIDNKAELQAPYGTFEHETLERH